MKLTSAIGFVIVVLGASAASAGYVGNKSDWDVMSDVQRQAYAMGAFDIWAQTDADAETLTYKKDIFDCASGLSLDSDQLVQVINAEYGDLSSWELPPFSVMLSGLRKVCLAHVNRARAERGDAPLQ